MKTLKTLTTLGAALLMSASISTAYAEEGDMTQIQDRTRTHLTLQASDADFAQSYNERLAEMNAHQTQSQNQHQYQYMNSAPTDRVGAGDGAMSSSMNRYTQRNAVSSTTVTGSTMAGSINRQTSTARSMGGGRR
jgi:opacity protein-like surface antigen